MEIDNHILSLSMEFEKQNIIVTEWETEKAKSKSDRCGMDFLARNHLYSCFLDCMKRNGKKD